MFACMENLTGKWVWKFKSPKGLPGKPLKLENHPKLKYFSLEIFHDVATLLTWEQRGIAWFLCRYGMVSSTTSGKLLNILGQHKIYGHDTFTHLNQTQQQNVINILDLCGYKFLPMDETEQENRLQNLCKLSKTKLLEKAQQYGITNARDSHTKETIARMIVQYKVEHGTQTIETDIQKVFIKNNFMFPLRKQSLTMGLLNEPCVLAALPYHVYNASRGLGDFSISRPGETLTGLCTKNVCICV